MSTFSRLLGNARPWYGYRPWTGDVELDLIELGQRVAYSYDERHAVIYRIGEAAGYRRGDVRTWLPESGWVRDR